MNKEQAQAAYNKESQDVVDSISNIADTIKKQVLKQEKIQNSSTKAQKKIYLKQLKNTDTYIESMFKALYLEMIERAKAEINLERIKADEREV